MKRLIVLLEGQGMEEADHAPMLKDSIITLLRSYAHVVPDSIRPDINNNR